MELSSENRQYLLRLARESIEDAAQGQEPPSMDLEALPEALRRERATFVTLNKQGQLRGCIGSLEAGRPLALDVRKNAIDAALHDPRFPPVQPDEVEDLDIEISVLSAPEPLEHAGGDDLIDKLRPGEDGVVIEKGLHRATFLPQVWKKIPKPRHFLQRLCRKARLPTEAYRDADLDVYTYQVDKFEE